MSLLSSLTTDLLPFALPGRGKPAVSLAPLPDAESFAALSERLGYLSKAEVRQVREAFRYADEAHLGQKRDSGLPYITHPLAVAGIVAQWRLDAQAVMAALLHDLIEDCNVTKADLVERFGSPTAELVEGLTKLDKLQFETKEQGAAENFRKMLLAMTRDVRVILIKLADRLHNMRTLGGKERARRARNARETLEIYAPIAHRLGLNQTYRELQELSFQHLYPARHAVISAALKRARGNRRDIADRVQAAVAKAFAEAKLKVQISFREKTVYSIYRKMREKHATFAQVNDIFGLRIIAGSAIECYTALGVLHQLYKPVPGRFKDFVAIPKANGYQSLHTTLVSPLGTPVEFQIRTESMDAMAETGIAAHWIYKHEQGRSASEAQRLGAQWLQSLLDIQDQTRDSAEFLEHVKIDLVPDAVYVFTPASQIKALPRGATAVDFAYAIHSDVGDRCVAARVNGEPVALRTPLASGDVVEIVTDPNAHPNPAWLTFVATARARSKIRHHLKTLAGEESYALGEKMLAQALRAEGLNLPPADGTDVDNGIDYGAVWQQLLRWSGSKTRQDLLTDLGLGRKIAGIVGKRLARLLIERGARPDAVMLTLGRYGDEQAPSSGIVTIDGSEGASVQLAPCCKPIPGDELVGYLGRGEGLIVHTTDCKNGRRLAERDRERFMRVEWSDEPVRAFETGIALLVDNTKGALARLAAAVSAAEADITHIEMNEERASEHTELKLTVSVRDRQHLADVLRVLKRAPPVHKAGRVKP